MAESNNSLSIPDAGQINQNHRLAWLKIFSCIVMSIGLASMILSTILNYGAATFNFITYLILGILFASGWGSYELAKRGRLKLGSWLIIGIFMLVLVILFVRGGTTAPLYIAFLVPIAISAVLLGLRPVLFITAFSMLFTVGYIVAVDFLGIFTPFVAPLNTTTLDGVHLLFVTVIIPGLIAIVGIPFRAQARAMEQQNRQLRELLQTLQSRHETIETVSHNVQSLSSVLKASAQDQDNSSREQVSSVHQVNNSLQELHATASHIATVSQQVNEAAEAMNVASLKIEQISQQGVVFNQQGIAALQRTTYTTTEIAQLYENLLTVLQELNTKSANMRQILHLLKNITNQTHLLALNASIEAAGAGATGARFAVVAQQIKELAGNANRVREQVERDVSDIEETTANAVQAVMIGYDKSVKLGQVNADTQNVFSNIYESANEVQNQSDDICAVAENVKNLTETVRLATNQQRSATEQILTILSGLNVIAQQNAASSQQVSTTVQQLEEMSEQLIYSLAA